MFDSKHGRSFSSGDRAVDIFGEERSFRSTGRDGNRKLHIGQELGKADEHYRNQPAQLLSRPKMVSMRGDIDAALKADHDRAAAFEELYQRMAENTSEDKPDVALSAISKSWPLPRKNSFDFASSKTKPINKSLLRTSGGLLNRSKSSSCLKNPYANYSTNLFHRTLFQFLRCRENVSKNSLVSFQTQNGPLNSCRQSSARYTVCNRRL